MARPTGKPRGITSRLLTASNWILLIMQFFAGLAVATSLMLRETYTAISNDICGDTGPLMNSPVADITLRAESVIVVVLILAASFWKELKIGPLRWRLAANGGVTILLMLLQALLMLSIYAPVFEARPL